MFFKCGLRFVTLHWRLRFYLETNIYSNHYAFQRTTTRNTHPMGARRDHIHQSR